MSKRRDSPKRHDRIGCSIVPAVVAGVAQLPDADRGQANVAPTRKSKDETKDNDHGKGSMRRQPQRKRRDEAHGDGQDHRVESAHYVGYVTGQPPAEDGSGVEDGDELVRKGQRYPRRYGIGAEIGQRNEQGPFDEEDA